ncbi:hypothetical protein RCC89_10175 [Cytophagaceae bacterium ABcell3]|nr:hypothetical protein RCC89_10175 [Cytophagaceae bacterium ABcell3]
MSSQYNLQRLYHFDFLRLFLVLAALLSHYLISQDWRTLMGTETVSNIRLLTRMSLPGLLIIFGFMVEYIYASKWKVKGGATIFNRMLYRTILSYLAFVALAFVGLLAGHTELRIFAACIVFLSTSLHAHLFKYYAILIPLTFLLMSVRFKFGFVAKSVCVAALIATAELLNSADFELHYALQHFAALTFGYDDILGPSIMHSFAFVLCGSIAANFILKKKNSYLLALTAMGVTSAVLLGHEIYNIGFSEFKASIADYDQYRANNSYVYFCYGIVSFLLLWVISMVAAKFLNSKIKNVISVYGGNTFSIFFFGNMIILLTPNISTNITITLLGLLATLALSLYTLNILNWATEKLHWVKMADIFIKKLNEVLFSFVLRINEIIKGRKKIITINNKQKR